MLQWTRPPFVSIMACRYFRHLAVLFRRWVIKRPRGEQYSTQCKFAQNWRVSIQEIVYEFTVMNKTLGYLVRKFGEIYGCLIQLTGHTSCIRYFCFLFFFPQKGKTKRKALMFDLYLLQNVHIRNGISLLKPLQCLLALPLHPSNFNSEYTFGLV